MPRISTGRPLASATVADAPAGAAATPAPAADRRRSCELAVVVARRRSVEPDLEVVGAAGRAAMASPHSMSVDAAVVEQLAEAEVDHLAQRSRR